MPWYLEKNEIQSTIGGTGAASSEAFTALSPKAKGVSLHLRAAGSDEDIAVVRLNSSQRATSITTLTGTQDVFSIEDLDAALQAGGLEPIGRKTYQKLVEALQGA